MEEKEGVETHPTTTSSIAGAFYAQSSHGWVVGITEII
jgi:hypothetical protein